MGSLAVESVSGQGHLPPPGAVQLRKQSTDADVQEQTAAASTSLRRSDQRHVQQQQGADDARRQRRKENVTSYAATQRTIKTLVKHMLTVTGESKAWSSWIFDCGC